MKILLLGATGVTGRLILDQLLERNIRPVLVGRNQQRLSALAESYGGLELVVADAQQPEALRAVINSGDLLISTVGPFDKLGRIPLQVAIEQGAHYMDSTGEPGFISHVYNDYEQQLKNTQSVIMTSCGFDYVPGQLAAAKLLSEVGEQAVAVNVTYSTADGSWVNPTSGTLDSLMNGVLETARFYNDGRLHEQYLGSTFHTIKAGNRTVKAISLSGTECFELPRIYPQLKDVNVYLGWFGSWGGMVSLYNRLQHKLYKVPGYLSLMRAIVSRISVPKRTSPSITAKHEGPSLVVAEAFNSNGVLLRQRQLTGHNMYFYTGEIMAWMAAKIQAGEIKEFGVVGPVRAFGLDELEQGHKEIGFVFVDDA